MLDLLERRARSLRLMLDEATDHIRTGRLEQASTTLGSMIVKTDELKTLVKASREQ